MTHRQAVGQRVARLLVIVPCVAAAALVVLLALALVVALVAPDLTVLLSDKPLLD